MKYFNEIIFFVALSISLGSVIWYVNKLKKDHFFKLTVQALCKRQALKRELRFFNSAILRQVIALLLSFQGPRNYRALLNLCIGKTKPAEEIMKKKGKEILALGLRAFSDPAGMTENVEEYVRKYPEDERGILLLAQLYFAQGNYLKARFAINRLKDNPKRRYIQAEKNYISAYFDMQDGDLLKASEEGSRAVKLFNKDNNLYEEGKAHLLLGTIYRAAAIEDVSYFMLQTALKIFTQIKAERKVAETLGNLGMLTTIQKRFDEADDYFQKALQLNQDIKYVAGEAEIINQMALTALLEGKKTKAENLAYEAVKLHQKTKNQQGEAFSQEILAHIFASSEDWKKVKKFAELALANYKGSANKGALLESYYLLATAEFKLGNMPEAEKLLRNIIAIDSKNKSCFHVANAYNLLGLLFMQKGELRRAKGIFQQSISCEAKADRWEGMTADYANISLIEWKAGLKEQALKSIDKALENAKSTGQEELQGELENRRKELIESQRGL